MVVSRSLEEGDLAPRADPFELASVVVVVNFLTGTRLANRPNWSGCTTKISNEASVSASGVVSRKSPQLGQDYRTR